MGEQMNTAQQAARRTQYENIRADMARLAQAWDDELAEKLGALADQLATQVGAERTARLDLAKEQRSYVDGADAVIKRQVNNIEEVVVTEAQLRLKMDLGGLWGRLRWLLTGKR